MLSSFEQGLIYDYFVNEWTERQCQDLTSYYTYDNEVYSTGGNKVFKEKGMNKVNL